MMDKKNANGFSSKASESGSQRKQLPYSVETPYGFHLDLDFLKYVDDIEKGNTIKRVHIQRRNKGPKFSTLPRNFSLPGHGSRTAPKDSWASTSTLGPKPKSRVMEVQQIFEFRACESGSLGHPRVPGVIQKSTREDVGVRVFDEQPLGVHVRPHLLRASSMPVTVLQRKNSESVEDKGAQATGNSCKENGSSENVFATSEVADLHQQVATALQRIRELEEQVRTIPELQAEICSLREEKEQLLLKLKSQTPVLTEDSVEPTEQKDNEVQSSVNPEASVVVVTTSSMDQQELPSPVQDIQQSVTNQQEPEKQTDTEMPLEQQTEMAESPSAQELAEGQPAENPSEPESVIEDVVTDTTAAGEPTHQEPEQSTSTQELVTQDKIAESSSAQESTQQEPTQSTSTQELLIQDKFEENSSAQESVEQEPTESPSTSKLVLQDQIVDNSSAEELTQQQTAQNTSEQALVMQNNIVEVSVEQESAQQELTQSPSTEDLAKQDKITEGSSAQEHTQKEPSLSPTTQETVMQDQIAENPSAQEPAEEEPAQCVATQESLKQDAAAESSSVQEFAEEQTTEVPIAQQSASQESEEPTTTQETVEQDKLSENTALEPAEKETKEGPTAQELMKQDDVSQGSSAQEFEEETTEPPTAQESVLQGAAESTVLKEEVRKEELGDDSSSPEAAEQKATESSTAQEVAVQDQMSENCLASESVFQEEAARSQKVEGAEEMQVWGIKEGHTGKEIDETDGDLDILSQQISSVSENLTIKMLQEKLMALEEKFSDANRELEKTNTLLREQMEENKLKEERIKQLTEEAEDFEKAEKAQVSQDTGALEETKQKETSDLALSCDVSVSTDLAPKTLSKGVSTDEELLLPDTAPIAGEQQKHLVHSGTQTDLTDAQEVSTDVVTVEQFQEVEITVHSQVVETALQKEFSTAIQEEPAGTAEEAEGSVVAADSQLTASDGADEAGPSAELQQPSQSDQDQEPERQGLSEPATSNVAIGQYVNKIHGLLNEQWACLGSGHTEIATTLKQPASKFSSIQTQLVSSLNALSAFYSSPGQKGGASRQAGLKSIMKKNDPADKPGNGGAKKNLKFVGVNGGYETTSSEESSGEDNADEDNAEEDSSEPEVEEKDEGPGVGAGAATEDVAEEPMPEGAEAAAPLPEGDTVPPDTMDPDASASPQEEQPGREPVHEGFMAACHYIKDRQAEVATPDKEMREFLTVLYQEWFRVSSQKDSLVDTVTLYLKEVGAATPTLLRFIVNLADGNGNSALHYSVSHSNFPIVKLLLDTGLCEVDNQNKAGYTAVMLASLTAADGPEDMEVALQLLRQGNVNARASQAGQTALMLAVSHGRSAMVRLLLTCEADVNMQDHDGSTALMCACEHGHTDIARLLLERDDCDLSLTDREGHDALAVAAQASHSEMIDLLKAHTGDGASAAPKPL